MTRSAEHIDDDRLSALVDDQLAPDDALQVRVHLETCPVCQERLDEFRSVASLLRRLPDVEPPRDFALGPRLLVDPPNVIRLRRWYVVARASAASLAALFVFLSVGTLYVDSRSASSPAAQLAATSRDASSVAPAAAPAAPAAQSNPPGAVAGAAPKAAAPAAARAVQSKPQREDDQVEATTSVSPLPTNIPVVLQPTAYVAARQPEASRVTADPAGPLRSGAAGVGVLAVLTLLTTLAVRRRLRQQTAPHL